MEVHFLGKPFQKWQVTIKYSGLKVLTLTLELDELLEINECHKQIYELHQSVQIGKMKGGSSDPSKNNTMNRPSQDNNNSKKNNESRGSRRSIISRASRASKLSNSSRRRPP